MAEKLVEIATADGQMETFIAHPDRPEPCPAVILYMDAPGIRGELRDFARRIADQGYFCLLPDMYYRRGRVRFDVSTRTVADREEMFGHMRSLTNELVLRDTRAILDALESEAQAAPGPIGCIGYCMSGQYVMSAVGTFPERFRAGVSCYGVAIVTGQPDSPHLLASRVKGELFFAFASTDPYVSDDVIPTLRSDLEKHGVAHQIEVYPDTEHGFCFPERQGMYAESAAEDVWRRSFELFERQLQS